MEHCNKIDTEKEHENIPPELRRFLRIKSDVYRFSDVRLGYFYGARKIKTINMMHALQFSKLTGQERYDFNP